MKWYNKPSNISYSRSICPLQHVVMPLQENFLIGLEHGLAFLHFLKQVFSKRASYCPFGDKETSVEMFEVVPITRGTLLLSSMLNVLLCVEQGIIIKNNLPKMPVVLLSRLGHGV